MFGILPLHNLLLLGEWCTAQCVFVHKLLQARMCIILRNLHEKCRLSKSGELVMKDLEVAAKNFLRQSFLFRSCISKYISASGPGGCWLPRGICARTCTCKYISTATQPASCHRPTRVNLVCKKGSVPVRGECAEPTSSRFLSHSR